MSYVVLDFETYYDKDYSLRKMTPVEYILDPRFEVIGCAVIERNGEYNTAHPSNIYTTKSYWLDADQFQRYVRVRDLSKRVVVCHHALFDASILSWRYGVVPWKIVDTMAMARALVYAFIGKVSLEAVAEHLGLPPKGTTIKNVSGMHAADIKAAGLWDAYAAYARHDAWLCEQVFLRLAPSFPKEEFDILDLVTKCAVVPKFELDSKLLAQHAAYLNAQKETQLARCGLTDRVSLMSNDKFAEALRSLGVEPETKTSPATGNQTYAFAKSDPFMIALSEHEDERVQALAAARIGHKSTLEQTRTEKLLRISKLPWYVAGSPSGAHFGRCPIPLRYSGAHTHRLSGDWGLNAQNWPRYTMYDDKPKETGLLRRAHKAPPGFVVVKRDASQIEARVVAWLAGQNDLLLAFADGRDVYCEFGTFASGRTITKADVDDRFVFKSAVLGLGFGVGAPKFVSDVAAKSYVNLGHSIKLDITQGGNIVNAYRQKYSKIPKAWRELQNLIPEMTRPGTRIPWGPVVIEHGAVLLPNGLRLFYHKLHYDTERQEWMFKYGKVPKKLYGGKLFENIVQALARIITMDAARRFEYPLAHQVHDDLVYIVPEGLAESFSMNLGLHMNRPPDWAKGLPLASEGGIGPNYGDAH
jgi:DNA polymerase III epsilon subunit-like protein